MKKPIYIGLCSEGDKVSPVADTRKKWTVVSINLDATVTVKEKNRFGSKELRISTAIQVFKD